MKCSHKYSPFEQTLEVSGCPELSVSLSGCIGAECRLKSLGPGLGDRPLRSSLPSWGPFRMSVIINLDRVAAVWGMIRDSSWTVIPSAKPKAGWVFSLRCNTLAVFGPPMIDHNAPKCLTGDIQPKTIKSKNNKFTICKPKTQNEQAQTPRRRRRSSKSALSPNVHLMITRS